ncbi:MAG: AmmeMemoRadiSam system protein A [Erysipelotrichaceae bacterium]|nr:AmmeMemoRadiSam system protein A [Erysipelotrichaceae bacterium]MBQ6494336.1 AmmeMemoRadiSam system protein A [Erysipelotrichaceae bacterium]
MSILAGFMVPHPPMIVPDIGKGEEKQIAETIAAYEEVAEEIRKLEPETIIITSPHAIMYADYFHISPGRYAKGSFERFRAPQVSFSEEYDYELTERICDYTSDNDFPAGILGERDPELDHGTMVPLYFIRKKYKEGKIVRIGLSGLSLSDHYRLGMYIRDAVNDLGRRVVFVASGDLSHKLQPYGPYGFAKEGPEYDERIMNACSGADFGKLFDFDESFCDKAAECGHRSFVIMAGAFDGMNVTAKALSHEDVTGVGYGICTFYPERESQYRHFLDQYEKKKMKELEDKRYNSDAYVRLARKAIEYYVINHRHLPLKEVDDRELLKEKAGTFVSIHKDGRLRGCIGTIMAVRDNVASEIIGNAVSACSRDPRFPPIREDELKDLEISVDVLGEIEDIDSPEQLDVKRYGVIVSCGERKGLLLPDLDGVDTVEEQIDIAREKGGIRKNENYKLQRFEVVRHY